MENLSLKKNALKSLIKELALMDDEEPKGSVALKGSAVEKLEGSEPAVKEEEPSYEKENMGAKEMEEAGEVVTDHQEKSPKLTPSMLQKMEFEDLSLEDLKKLKAKLSEKGLL